MTVKNKSLIVALFVSLLTPMFVVAQSNEETQSTANSQPNSGNLMNENDVVVVGSVKQIVSKHALGTPAGPYMLLNTPQGLAYVNLGPYLSNGLRTSLANAQLVQVTGITKTANGKSYLLARQIQFDGKQVHVRNQYGFLLRQEIPVSRVHNGQTELNGGAL
jgi:hypothetical protein